MNSHHSKNHENTNKCAVLNYKDFTIKVLVFRHVSTLYRMG